MNRIFKGLIFGCKLIICAILLFWTAIFLVPSNQTHILGSFLFGFVALFTIFIFFGKKLFLTFFPKGLLVWRIISVIYVIMMIVFVSVMVWAFSVSINRLNTKSAVNVINNQKITLFDVFGNNLPPKPNQALNDSTIAGIDANHNFIRDDVELAIFAKYPNSARLRAAELQYAQALQLELTQVYNSGTLVAVLQKESLGFDCVGQTAPKVSLKNTHEEILASLKISDDRTTEVENLVFNTDMRKKKESDNLKYMTSYLLPAVKQECDIDPSTLPN